MNSFAVVFAVAANKDGVAQVGKCCTWEESANEQCLLDVLEDEVEESIGA